MLEIESILIRNFWSYGDYDTVIKLDDLGPCLITGQIHESASEDGNDQKDSNGAGKSALVEAILWCLFGRTMRIPNPGDKVINFFTGKECIVELMLKNGDRIRRTRGMDGHNDLLHIKNGELDISLGTNKIEQKRLDRLFDLDFDIFCGSQFFSQFAQSWMEMSDQRRKEALEREFRMDQIQFRAESAKDRLDKAENEQRRFINIAESAQADINSLKDQIDKFTKASLQFEEGKRDRIADINTNIATLESQLAGVQFPDVDQIKKVWETFNQAASKLRDREQKIYDIQAEKRRVENDVSYQKGLIRKWEAKGPICSECERVYDEQYIASKTSDPKAKLAGLESQLNEIAGRLKTEETALATLKSTLEARRPAITVSQIDRQYNDKLAEKRRIEGQLKTQREALARVEAEENHYDDTIKTLEGRLAQAQERLEDARIKIGRFDKLILHMSYIYKAYSDRRKIKSYILVEYIPYLNSRIDYYLQRFGFDLRIEFTNALGMKSDKWGYQQFSGGECKRFDVAMMLAMFDLHTLMYGRRANIVVFDEVDGRLDMGGAEIFADIIRSDFAGKVDSVLVISQRLDMKGSMPSEIVVVREDRFSRIAEILK